MMQKINTPSGVNIEFDEKSLDYQGAIDTVVGKLNSHRGALFTSNFEFPGRYTCWDIGFYNPPLAIVCQKDQLFINALNKRGEQLLSFISPFLAEVESLHLFEHTIHTLGVTVLKQNTFFSEEQRSQQPSVFSALRVLLNGFKTKDEPYLGLYGAFGYDLIFQFEAITQKQVRPQWQRDMVLYLPDEIYVVNHRKEIAFIRQYEFSLKGQTTKGLERSGLLANYQVDGVQERACDHEENEYINVVQEAKKRFACGDLFEVVPSQTFYRAFSEQPSHLFLRMQKKNPSPYGFFINLGEGEFLVGASPEMYVRVQGRRVETCPISGTIKRGEDAIEDAHQIQSLLESEKECSELTMCTDVDRNDKSRICEPGSVRVIGRRQIEMYSRLIHTVDHIEGYLREEFDAIDAFLTHMWVVTVTGAPKLWAMNFIEEHEKSPRQWYGGAVGWLNFNGDLNTGLVLRTMHLKEGTAAIRVGATLLYDSDAASEEAETRLKASAFLELLNPNVLKACKDERIIQTGKGKKILLIDHQDSFVHTLANYLRQTGAQVTTVRYDHALTFMQQQPHDLIVLSPGPGKPDDFNTKETIRVALEQGVPLFGVCLGLQAIVEYFAGRLRTLDYPVHGKPAIIEVINDSPLYHGLDKPFTAGRYHSLYARKDEIPNALTITAITDKDIVMGIAHQTLPIWAVQFHPETILSMPNQAGLKLITNLMKMV